MKLPIVLILSFFVSTILLGQDSINSHVKYSSTLKSYSFVPVISDTTSLTLKDQLIPSVNVGDIVGQTLVSGFAGLFCMYTGFIIAGSESSGEGDAPLGGGPSQNARLFASLGYGIGVGLGIFFIADRDKYDPSFFLLTSVSVLCSYLGYIIWDNNHKAAATLFIVPPLATIITLNVFMQKETNIKVGFDVQQLPQPNAYSYGMKVQYAF